jgi:mRNA interferase MazF
VNRGDLYRVRRPGGDTKRARVFVVVSRPALVASKFSTVICAPVYSQRRGLSTEVAVDAAEGLAHESGILCDALVSLPKHALTAFIGSLSRAKLGELDRALRVALHIEQEAP